MKQFKKVKFFSSTGLLSSGFNYETLKFERSAYFRMKCYANTLLKVTFTLKIFVSTFYARENPIQL